LADLFRSNIFESPSEAEPPPEGEVATSSAEPLQVALLMRLFGAPHEAHQSSRFKSPLPSEAESPPEREVASRG
jgi:hypothetical protein